jgi:hypothetical protein
MIIFKADVSSVDIVQSTVIVDSTSYNLYNKKYNVTIEKNDDEYIIKCEEPEITNFFERVYDENILKKVSDNYISVTKPLFFGLIPSKKYCKWLCELKERKKIIYRTNKIIIKKETDD